MKIHFRTVLVSSAALAITGGAAFAYINATAVEGGGTATTSAVSTTGITLTADATGIAAIPGPATVLVTADNASTAPLRIPTTTTVEVTTGLGCPADSFDAVYTPIATDIPGLANDAPAGSVVITFVNSSTVDQSGCNGATLTLTFNPS